MMHIKSIPESRGSLPRWIVLAMVAFNCSCATDAVTKKRVTNIYSLDEDVAMGQATLAENTRQMKDAGVKVNEDTYRLRQLEEIVGRKLKKDFPANHQIKYTDLE